MSPILVKYKSNDGSLKIEGMFIELDIKSVNKFFQNLEDKLKINDVYSYWYSSLYCISYENIEEIYNDYEIIPITIEEYKNFINKGLKELGFVGPLKDFE
jgi:hypothetical protein